MSNTIILKKSSVASKVPLATDLTYGELAINYADGKLYFKDSSNAIKSFIDSSSLATVATSGVYADLSGKPTNVSVFANDSGYLVAADIASKASLTGVETLTNKRITGRVLSATTATTLTINGDTTDQYIVSALASAMTIASPTGTPTEGQQLIIRIKDNGTAQTLTWNAIFREGATLPTTTTISKTTYVGCIYNSADSVWDVVAVTTQA
jgi:hypothetical protein